MRAGDDERGDGWRVCEERMQRLKISVARLTHFLYKSMFRQQASMRTSLFDLQDAYRRECGAAQVLRFEMLDCAEVEGLLLVHAAKDGSEHHST